MIEQKIVKMVRVNFISTMIEKFNDNSFFRLKSVYDKYSSRKLNEDNTSYWSSIPSGISYDKWKEMVDDKTIDKFLSENFIYDSFTHCFSIDDFNDFDFYDYKSGLYSIQDRFEIAYTPKIVETDVERALALINTNITLFDKQLEQLNKIGDHHFNQKCNSPVVDNFLSSVNQILLLEDACSDYLQSKLKEGWRIISVTPQPNQRRPDYVLGMIVENPENSALRI